MIAPQAAATILDGAPAIDPAVQSLGQGSSRRAGRSAWIALGGIVLATALARWRVLDAPLERDEGEYAYVGQLLLRGIPPYAEAYNMKLPGIYAIYAGILAVFGETARGIHQGLLAANLAAIVLVFLLVRLLFDEAAALASAAGFAVLSISSAVLGIFANGEHFILPFALLGLVLVQSGLERGQSGLDRGSKIRLLLGGLLLGCGVVVKQHGFVFPLAAGILAATEPPFGFRRAIARATLVAAAVIVPYLVTCAAMALAGVFPSFWLWTFRYARAYVSRVGFAENAGQLSDVARAIFETAPLVCAFAGFGLASLAWDPASRRRARFVLVFTALSVASVFPGYLFRAHYFVMTLPALALLFGLGAAAAGRILARSRPALGAIAAAALAVLAVGHSVVLQRAPLFRQHPLEIAWNTIGSPFHLAPTIGERLKRETAPSDRIGILGSEPELCFYADRRSASGFLYTYALMEDQPFAPAMLEQFEREIESRAPRVLVWVELPWSWLPSDDPYRKIVGWFQRVRRDYDLVARYDIGVPGLRVLEGAEIEREPKPQYSIDLWRRRAR